MSELTSNRNILTVLTENIAGGRFLAEHGLSYLIQADGKTVLFDTGHSDVYRRNAEKLGIDLHAIDLVVLSHGHWDHGDGLQHISGNTLVAHPNVFMPRFRKNGHAPIGLKLGRTELEQRFGLVLTAKPYFITENLIFLGQIPRNNNFEAQSTDFVDAQGNPDYVLDDSALVLVNDHKLKVITACSHAGICNIVDYARAVTGVQQVELVLGGFHLKHDNVQTRETAAYFKQLGVERIYPSHCTDLPAMAVFYSNFKVEQLRTGMSLNL